MVYTIYQQQRQPLLSQTFNSNGKKYNNNNMNLPYVKPKRAIIDNIPTTTSTTPLSNLKQ
jgi:hypothetical protein